MSTIAEIDGTLRSGFHDALIHRISVDYVASTAVFELEISVGDPDAVTAEERDKYRMARLELSGLEYLSCDLPQESYGYRDAKPIRVDLVEPSVPVPQPRGAGAFCGTFFVNEWNGFLHFAAADAGLVWLAEPS